MAILKQSKLSKFVFDFVARLRIQRISDCFNQQPGKPFTRTMQQDSHIGRRYWLVQFIRKRPRQLDRTHFRIIDSQLQNGVPGAGSGRRMGRIAFSYARMSNKPDEAFRKTRLHEADMFCHFGSSRSASFRSTWPRLINFRIRIRSPGFWPPVRTDDLPIQSTQSTWLAVLLLLSRTTAATMEPSVWRCTKAANSNQQSRHLQNLLNWIPLTLARTNC